MILIQFPTRERPEQFKKVFKLYVEYAKTKPFFHIVIDKDDKTMPLKETREYISSLTKNFAITKAIHKGKVHAVNDLSGAFVDWKILLLASDDMVPEKQGYDEIIWNDMQKHFPAFDGVLHYNDGYVGIRLNTISIMGVNYYRRFYYIYNPEYKSLCCDNEFMEVSQILGKQVYIENVIIRHQHPANIKGTKVYDNLYTKNQKFLKADFEIYKQRKAKNFGLK